MATRDDVKSVELTLLQRLYVQKSLDMLVASLKRANTNEANPQIRQLREADIATVGAIKVLF